MDAEQRVARMRELMADLDDELFGVLLPLTTVMARHMRGGMEALPSKLFIINARLCAFRNEMRAIRTDAVLLARLTELAADGLAGSGDNAEHATVADLDAVLNGPATRKDSAEFSADASVVFHNATPKGAA